VVLTWAKVPEGFPFSQVALQPDILPGFPRLFDSRLAPENIGDSVISRFQNVCNSNYSCRQFVRHDFLRLCSRRTWWTGFRVYVSYSRLASRFKAKRDMLLKNIAAKRLEVWRLPLLFQSLSRTVQSLSQSA
jgi:hypothetical protein